MPGRAAALPAQLQGADGSTSDSTVDSTAIDANRAWEVDRALMLERSELRAWRVAIAGIVLGLIGIAAVFVQGPLRRVVEIPILVDRVTGETTIQQRLSVETIPPLEVLDKHNLATIVRAREGYSWMFLQRDFDQIARMAVPAVFADYNRQFEGEAALQKKQQGARELTVVSNNTGNADHGIAALLKAGRVRKIICSFPRQVDSFVFDELYRRGKIELELVPHGNLAERIRAGGAGIGGVCLRTGHGTLLAQGKETRCIGDHDYVLELPIRADVALIKAEQGDRWGNLTFRKAARNFGPVMAMAARRTVASVYSIVELGALDPEAVVTPGIFVTALVRVGRKPTRAAGYRTAA